VSRRLVLLGLAAVAGCSSVLGLDAPTLDPCIAEGRCVDAALDVTVDASDAAASPDGLDAGDASDAGPEAQPEAAMACVWDGAVPDASGTGVRCGGGCTPVVFCASPQVCCQTTDAGVSAFACVSSETACGGYPIDCVNENDCTGSDVCCHYMAHTICAASCTSSADTACLPGSTDDCPAGKKCDVRVVDEDAAAPYYTCEP
jgi:hypothetical protein